MANMYIVPGMQEPCTDNDGNRFYDISCLDYRAVDISDIYNYTGEVNSDGHALDFEGAQAYTSDHFSTEIVETAFIAFAPDQKINYMTDVIALYFGGNVAIGFHIISKSYPAISGGNMSTIFDRPWLLASHNGFMGFIGTNDRGGPWDYEWNWVAFGNHSTQVGIGSFYPLEESEGVSVEYGWTDGGSGTLGQKEIRLYQGFSVSGAWRCAVNGVVSGAVTFEWYKDGNLISTQEKRTVSDCTPSADELGVFSYHCVVTHATGKTWETDPLTATVEVYNGGGGSGGGGDSSGGDEGGDDSGGDSGGGDDSGGDSGGDDPGGGGNEPTVSEAWVRSFKEGLALGLTGNPLPYTGKAEQWETLCEYESLQCRELSSGEISANISLLSTDYPLFTKPTKVRLTVDNTVIIETCTPSVNDSERYQYMVGNRYLFYPASYEDDGRDFAIEGFYNAWGGGYVLYLHARSEGTYRVKVEAEE